MPQSSRRNGPPGRLIAIAALAGLTCELRAQCLDPVPSNFQKQSLTAPGQLQEPLELAVAKDGKVFVVERFGRVMFYDPVANATSEAAQLDVYSYTGAYDVGGALGVAVSPEFPADNWVYLYYAARSTWNNQQPKETGRFTYYLSRFRFASGRLDLTTEQILLKVPSITETHNGGSLKFGKDGNLFLSMGDNHNPGCSNQYSPMDERAGFEWCDDQGTTANTNDLRGKIIRIHPEPNLVAGRYYSIPAGNLKEKYLSLWPAADQAKVLPEIYTMGHRNPYRIFPDPRTGRLHISEFGPAAGTASDRGPAGADEFSITDEPANLGYPYFIKDNQAYCHWDYGAKACIDIQGQPGNNRFVADKPVNYSKNNTGVNILPPAKPASLWEHDGSGNPDPIPGIKACGHGAGPVYHFDPALDSKIKFPPHFDGKWIIFPIFSASWQPKLATVPAAQHGRITAVADAPFNAAFTPGLHDMEFGTDGALYAVDYGATQYSKNASAGLFRIVYNGCLPPVSAKPLTREESVRGRLALGGGNSLLVPSGARGVEVFDLDGRKVWEKDLSHRPASHLSLPAGFARGLYRVRWR